MKSNEASQLRIGNYLIYHSWIIDGDIIDSIDANDIKNIFESETYAKSHDFIPLTPEILVKAIGMEKHGKRDDICNFYLNYDPEYHRHFGLWFNNDKYLFATLNGHIVINYLHELQNLFFVHYKSELAIDFFTLTQTSPQI